MATQSSFGVEASPDSVRSRHVDGELPEARVLLPSRTEEFDLEAEPGSVCDFPGRRHRHFCFCQFRSKVLPLQVLQVLPPGTQTSTQTALQVLQVLHPT